MITENYISFEIAKLLKEKGFGGECLSMYVTPKPRSGMGNPNEAKIAPHGRDSHYYEGYEYQCEAPTLQMAMKWLREVHNIHIEIAYNMGYFPICISTRTNDTIPYIAMGKPFTYEKACEVAIKYCLENLI